MGNTNGNYFSMNFVSKGENEAFARSTVAGFCLSLNPTIEEINDIKTAVSEAVTNSIVHGYENVEGEINLNVRLCDNEVHIEVIDNGIGIENIEKAREAFFTSKPNEERSGMGFTVMESVMDNLEVENLESGGVCVKMVKKIGAIENEDAGTQ